MSKKIIVVDYGMGNLHSVSKALAKIGAEVEVTSDVNKIKNAEKLILPGVGAFGDCMKNIEEYGLKEAILDYLNSKKPFLGICVGMQVLFEESEEDPGVKGLGFFKGKVEKIKTKEKIPHMGWNDLLVKKSDKFLSDADGKYVYFVHSYHAMPEDESIVIATCDYGAKITAAVKKDNVQAVQFHPEKSSTVGLGILKAFKENRI